MKHPRFNYKSYPADWSELKSGTSMNVGMLTQIAPDEEGCRTRMQMFDSGMRMSEENIGDGEKWNRCVYIDIDYKKWMAHAAENGIKYDAPGLMFKKVWTWLVDNYPDNTYYMEFSRSNNGFHIIYFFDDGYSSTERALLATGRAYGLTKKAFCECGYKEEIEYEGVLDACTKNVVQMIFYTGKGIINDKCTGNIVTYNFDYPNLLKEQREKREAKIKRRMENLADNTAYKFTLKGRHDHNKINYISHPERWRLFESLSRVFDDEHLEKEWCRCAEMIPEENGHSQNFYKNEPYKNDWYSNLGGDEWCDIKLLDKFGYTVDIERRRKTTAELFDSIEELLKINISNQH